MKLSTIYSLLGILVLITACNEDEPVFEPEPSLSYKVTYIEPSAQRDGDATAGYDYLVNGNYVSSGFPLDLYKNVFGEDPSNPLGRTGDNATIRYDYTAVTASNGTKIAVANCLQCHAQMLNGELIVGLGNSVGDFTTDQSQLVPLVDMTITNLYGANSPEWEAYEPFRTSILAIAPHLVTDVVGVNPADNLAALLAAYRDRHDLSWQTEPDLTIPNELVPTDVPAWWLMKKKNATLFSGAGRGDFARIFMASGLLTLSDSAEARTIDSHFGDVMAYLKSIEPPAYPEAVDQTLAAQGQQLFSEHCEYCHGTYGTNETYPNLLVGMETIGTDPLLAESNFSYQVFVDWYNTSWFGQEPNKAELIPGDGYVAQPLDGIWATAPYLHNGSVPTLEDLLNSTQRPTYWRRTLNTNDYDYTKVGWNYTIENEKVDKNTYDTTKLGFGNQGHTFGDDLTTEERTALIEYLKTL